MATEQCYYALAAYNRFFNQKNSLYDMADGEKPLAKPAKTAISSLKYSKAKTFVVKWKKVTNASRYQIVYSVSSKFTANKTASVSKAALSKTVQNLKSGKTYYV